MLPKFWDSEELPPVSPADVLRDLGKGAPAANGGK